MLLPNPGLIPLCGNVLFPCPEIPRQPFECIGSNLDLIDWMDWQIDINGLSAAAVACSLNARGIMGKRGGEWTHKQVS